MVWNKTRKKNDWGKWAPTNWPKSDWIRATVDSLRIIDEALWKRVESRRKETEGRTVRFASGRLSGRPPKHATVNLLAGLATCGICGGGIIVETGGHKRGRVPEYICHRHRANSSCSNALRIPVADLNEAVLQAIEEHALTPEAVEQVIQLSEREDVADQQTTLAKERKDIEKRINNVGNAIALGQSPASLLAKLREYEARMDTIDVEMDGLQPVPRLAPAVIENRLAEWRRLLRQSTTQARTVLQRVLRGRVTFTPRADGQGYDFEGPTRFDRLFSGIVAKRPAWIAEGDGQGTEHIRPEDTPDLDYGELLERACVKGCKRVRAHHLSSGVCSESPA